MVIYSRCIVLTRIFRCPSKKTLHWRIMPQRSLQTPPEKKLKPNQDTISLSRNVTSSSEHNLNTDLVEFDNMPAENQEDNSNTQPGNEGPGEKARIKVEYLDTPVKSENDKKEYRVIRLENGLTALLIADTHTRPDQEDDGKASAAASETEDEDDEDSEDGDDEEDEDDDGDDEEEDESDGEAVDEDDEDTPASKHLKREEKMAACGLCVGVGSFSDPPEIPGLAHFLEHMVFMGSEKYPQENDFDAFIKKTGGSDNASTECEQTTFYFEVHEKHLLTALDCFAQFFIKPLMKKDAIARERKAVDSEFQMALPSDFYRKEQLLCSFAKPNHPATKFNWGNLETLQDNVKDDELYEKLHKFRERHYSAHRMTIAIQGRLSLDVLEDYVTQCFANVPSNGLPPDDFSRFIGADSFDTPRFRSIYKIKPIKDVCQIELTWAMPPLHDLYRSKPHHYISWIIGHEGKGSLISYLRKKMWCLDIFSGNSESGFEHSSMYALFSLSLVLTDEGHKCLREVLNAIFSFINLMQKEGPQKRIYDEIHQILETNFRFIDEVPPAECVEDLCENMHFYHPRDYITGAELYFEYNPEAIQSCMNYLSADSVNIIICDKKFNDEEFDKVEPWFKTKYTSTVIPEDWIACWKTIEPLPEFHLPLPNVYLTDDFSLIGLPENISKYPTKIHADEISDIWYRPDPKFGLPECYMFFYLITPMAVSSAKNAALIDLFIGILKQLLVEELYPATACGLNNQISPADKGIIVNVNGFNQKLPVLLTAIAKCIASCSELMTEDLFNVMKKEQIKEYYNTFLKPGKLVKDIGLSILKMIYWPAIDKHAALRAVEFQEFENFVKSFTDHIYVQSLVQGNMTKEDTIKNVQNFIQILNCGPLLPNTMPELRVAEIPLGLHYCRLKNFNKTDVNSVVTNYYQCGIDTVKSSTIIQLIIMIMEEPLFHQLRTLEQLGYNVFCLIRETYGILGYLVTVYTQADKFTTDHVDKRIETFLEAFNKILKEMTEKELANVKEALMKVKQCADIHLKQEVKRNWEEIMAGQYMFDRIQQELSMIEGITIDELREWMKTRTINGSNLRKLSIQIVGTATKSIDKDNNEESELIEPESAMHDDMKTESGNVDYPLVYVPPSECKDEKATENYITDIQEYKRSLYIYPSNPTAL